MQQEHFFGKGSLLNILLEDKGIYNFVPQTCDSDSLLSLGRTYADGH